jgi:lathosterol oxidase
MPHTFSSFEKSLLALSAASFLAGCSATAVKATVSLATRLQPLDSIDDATVQGFFMLVFYVLQYAVLGGLFEGTHPNGVLSSTLAPKQLELRRKQVRWEIYSGVMSLVVTVALAVTWTYAYEPRTPFYAYFEKKEAGGHGVEWNALWGLGGLAAYVASFDTYFYWSHWLLHEIDFVWDHVHYFHHQYKEPSAFAQFAVHPIEAAVQGPIGHFCIQLWFPVHPVQLAVMGALSSAWAFAAHDGRWGDFNSHSIHHTKGRGRKHYFNLGFLTRACARGRGLALRT